MQSTKGKGDYFTSPDNTLLTIYKDMEDSKWSITIGTGRSGVKSTLHKIGINNNLPSSKYVSLVNKQHIVYYADHSSTQCHPGLQHKLPICKTILLSFLALRKDVTWPILTKIQNCPGTSRKIILISWQLLRKLIERHWHCAIQLNAVSQLSPFIAPIFQT